MYEYIEGKFKGIYKDYVVVDNQGLGFKIFTSGHTMSAMPAMDARVKLFLCQIVREDFIGLYGFAQREELELFERLLTVSGVGAKSALSLLSISTPEHLKRALVNRDEKHLCRASGIGKKTAMRLILELQDKFNLAPTTEGVSLSKAGGLAKEALLSLGYTEKEVTGALAGLKGELSVEDSIKQALKALMS